MDIKPGHVPKVYKCEECAPRTLKRTKTEAQETQLKLLEKKRRKKEKRKERKQKKQQDKTVTKTAETGKVMPTMVCRLFLLYVTKKGQFCRCHVFDSKQHLYDFSYRAPSICFSLFASMSNSCFDH